MAAAVELPVDYYLVNFRQLIDFVATHYASLLSPAELQFQQQFNALTVDAQMLYVRLLCRSKSLFRLSKLDYPEIADADSAVTQLAQHGYLTVDEHLPAEQLLPLFTRAELLDRLSPGVAKSAKRAEVERSVLAQFAEPQLQHRLLAGEAVLQVQREQEFRVYRLCFFGNLYQDMTDFVLRDLGLTRFEQYTISADTLAFDSRAQISSHLQYYACSELLDDVLTGSLQDIHKLRGQLPELEQADANLQRRVSRLVNTLARQLERLHAYPEALSYYRSTARPPSRERQARIHLTLGDAEQALTVCNEILQAPVTEEESQFATQFAARAARALRRPWPKAKGYTPPQEKLVLAQIAERVELITADHYSKQGQCFYCENALFNGVLGLAFWDVIFAPVKGVFFNPFQPGPADLYEADFHHSRSALIEDCWASLLSEEQLTSRVMSNFRLKHGLQNPLVHWQYLPEELLRLALQRIPLAHWTAVLRRLMSDLRHNRNGFPDLVLFPQGGGYCLVEVKGPGDTLQKNQLRWMNFFAKNGITHKVAHISWSEGAVPDSPV